MGYNWSEGNTKAAKAARENREKECYNMANSASGHNLIGVYNCFVCPEYTANSSEQSIITDQASFTSWRSS